MAYQTGKTIEQVINDIELKKYLLPSIQREYVWSTEQIEILFDSLMRGYPINSFLFWQVKKEKINQYQFYNFLREYTEDKIYANAKASVDGKEEIIAVLDGQQRLTSLYIGLKGTYSSRLKYKWKSNTNNYPKRKLYLNLLKDSKKETMVYDFSFLTNEEYNKQNDVTENYYYRVGDILNYDTDGIYDFIDDNFDDLDKEIKKAARSKLRRLHDTIKKDLVIFEYLEMEQDLDKVLNIFVRTNSGGTKLDYSDLLLSIASSQWTTDARQEIIGLVNEINNIGSGFNVDKDFVLKSCLVLADLPSVVFKVGNFNKDNMRKIEDEWENIKETLSTTFKLISSFGYQGETLPSNNAIIPIAYYLHRKDYNSNFITKFEFNENRKTIKDWLAVALLKRVFSGQPDSVLTNIRNIINASTNEVFPAKEIKDDYISHPSKSFMFDQESIRGLISSSKYGNKYTFLLLQFLYPTFDFKNKFHVDHIHPKAYVNKNILKKRDIELDSDTYYYMKDKVNNLANLQLLEGTANIEKSDKQFVLWFDATYSVADSRKAFCRKHYIPVNESFEIENFKGFFEAREKLIFERLMSELVKY
ncbi:DUF262 domain-containing protein [Mycoplasmatota bacterium zrk1]